MQSQASQSETSQFAPGDQSVELVGSREFQQQVIGLDLAKLVSDSSGDLNQMLQGLVRVVLEQSQCNGLWLASLAAVEPAVADRKLDFVPLIEPNALWPIAENPLRSLVNKSVETGTVCLVQLEGHSKISLISAPVLNRSRVSSEVQLILTGCFNNVEESELRQQWLMSMAAQTISQWQQARLALNQDAVNKNLQDAFGVVHGLSQTESTSSAARVIVNHLQTSLGCDQVALSLCDAAASVTISAVSGVEQVDLQSEYATKTIAALQQPFIQNSKVDFAVGEEKRSAVELALENYCVANGCEAAIALPIFAATKVKFGSVLIGCSNDQFQNQAFQAKCQQIVDLIAGYLPTVLRANESLFKTLLRRITMGSNAVSSLVRL